MNSKLQPSQMLPTSSSEDPLLVDENRYRAEDKRSLSSSTAKMPLKSPFRLNSLRWGLAVITGIWFAITTIYAWAVVSTSGPLTKLVPSNAAHTITILRILTEAASKLLTALFAATLEVVFWALASSKKGIALPSLLGMSSSTGLFGLFALLFWKPKGKWSHYFWVATRCMLDLLLVLTFRLSVLVMIPLMSIFVFCTYPTN